MDLNKLIYKLKQLPKHGAGADSGGGGTPSVGGEITISTLSAINNGNNSLTLRGNVQKQSGFKGELNDKGFRFGTDTNASNNTYTQITGTGATDYGTFSLTMSNLIPGQTYYFDAIARTAEPKDDGPGDGKGDLKP